MNTQTVVGAPSQLGPVIRALRVAKKLTQQQLAAKMGVSQTRVARIEKKPGATSLNQINHLISLLGGRLLIEFSPTKEQEDQTPAGARAEW